MGTKMAAAFANIYMAAIQTQILSQSGNKPLEWKYYINDQQTRNQTVRWAG